MLTKTSNFQLLESRYIESLCVNVEYYRHTGTGARHYHIQRDDSNQVFMVALRTLPQDSTGVAHILEHTVLCGSKNYPVRDPFFLMSRRSLSNFMNAFTASDWTAYPFATENTKDYENLLKVYLDAVFFPTLDEYDFMQEGWRLDVNEAEQNSLHYKGVVFNEMKGAMSSPVRQVWHELCKHLYQKTTYHFNSGGDPSEIPNLGYRQLCDFHQTYYHPSNATFFTYGNQNLKQSQQLIEEYVLQHFEYLDNTPQVGVEERPQCPKKIYSTYPLDDNNIANKTHVVVGWLLGENTDIQQLLRANLLNLLLFDNASSPLQKCLEESDLGTSPSPLCGLDDDHKEMLMVAGFEGAEVKNADAIEELILSELTNLAKNGLPQEHIDSSLHQLELAQRDISSSGMPYGLSLILNVTSVAIHGADVVDLLDIDQAIKQLRQDCNRPNYIQSLILELLNNNHRLTLVMSPDTALASKQQQAEKQRLHTIRKKLSQSDIQNIIQKNATLNQRQEQKENIDCLPSLKIEDINTQVSILQPYANYKNSHAYTVNCNGLDYVKFILQPSLNSPQQWQLLPLYCALLGELGQQQNSFAITQNAIARYTGGIGFSAQLWQPHQALGNDYPNRVRIIGGSKGLHTNHHRIIDLLNSAFSHANFSEQKYIRDLVAQLTLNSFHSVTSNGHLFAMQASASSLSNKAKISYAWSGIQSIQNLIALNKKLDDSEQLNLFCQQLVKLSETLNDKPSRQWLLISDASNISSLQQTWDSLLDQNIAATNLQDDIQLDVSVTSANIVWATESQVHYCAKAYKAVAISHKDSPALTVLAHYLRNVYLHTAIREKGGAYGGGAQYNSASSTFQFYSYRDPRTLETLNDFDDAIQRTFSKPIKQEDLEQAILSAASKFSAALSPPNEAQQDFYALLNGVTPEFLNQFRLAVTQVSIEDLKYVVQSYLIDKKYANAIITNQNTADELQQKHNFSMNKLYI